jgi:hypothetical protein
MHFILVDDPYKNQRIKLLTEAKYLYQGSKGQLSFTTEDPLSQVQELISITELWWALSRIASRSFT